MIGLLEQLDEYIKKLNIEITIPKFTAIMTEDELCKIIGDYDGWIIGDDPCSEKVIYTGSRGNLKALIKWGVGIDNIDFEACKKYKIPVTNTPAMFGEEVSDIAINYLLTLARETHIINKKVREGNWYKPAGMSLSGKKVALIGFGDIGRHVAKKLLAFNLNVNVVDPSCSKIKGQIKYNYGNGFSTYTKELSNLLNCINSVNIDILENSVKNADFIIITCALNKHTKGMINKEIIKLANKGVIIINVARGPIIVENDIIKLLDEGYIKSVGFDVFEEEPLAKNSKLMNYEQNIYGSHNGYNTIDAVLKTSKIALEKLNTNLELWYNMQE